LGAACQITLHYAFASEDGYLTCLELNVRDRALYIRRARKREDIFEKSITPAFYWTLSGTLHNDHKRKLAVKHAFCPNIMAFALDSRFRVSADGTVIELRPETITATFKSITLDATISAEKAPESKATATSAAPAPKAGAGKQDKASKSASAVSSAPAPVEAAPNKKVRARSPRS
jgi:hypothetical protein